MKKFDPSKKTTRWNPRREFDVVAVGADNSIVWRDYGDPRRHVVTKAGENPREIAERNEKREREQKRKPRTE